MTIHYIVIRGLPTKTNSSICLFRSGWANIYNTYHPWITTRPCVWNANTVTCLPTSIICIRDTIISSTHTFMSGPSMNILTYFPYIRSPLTNILRAYCDIRSVFFIISRAFVDMYSARFTMCCQNFVICGSFSYRLALRSLRLTACGP